VKPKGSVIVVVALLALLVATCAPAFAGLAHDLCAAQRHDCGKPRIADCCCGSQVPASAQSTPASSRVEVRPDWSAIAVLPSVVASVSMACSASAAVSTVPFDRRLLDRPTLYSFLRL
jgi:hypothetical protein